MSAAVRTVAVVGAGGSLGRRLVAALLARPERLTVRATARSLDPAALQRSRLDALQARGAVLLAADLADGSGLDAACSGADAVISAVQGGPDIIVDGQSRLLQACQRHSVGRLIPSDYSMNPFALDKGENWNSDWRRAFAARVRASGIGHSFILNGGFMEVMVSPFMQLIDAGAGTLSHWGDGKTRLQMTSMADAAAYVAAAILDPATANRAVEVVGDAVDVAGMAAAYRAATGRQLQPKPLGSIEAGYARLAQMKAEGAALPAMLPLMYALPMFSGKAALRHVENARFPAIEPLSLASFLRASAAAAPGGRS